jgi:D-alanyl-D-alanine carboxypeptidase/D-alanyl-D-alanine-endopeptidase (penicillin-binding protein 4)
MTRRVLALVAAGALALVALPARAYVPEKTPKRHLEASIRRTIALPPVRPSLPGLLILRAGRPVLQMNPDREFLPASLLKLGTTMAAILRFGPSHRFATRVVGSKPVAGATGTVWLVGGGDPTFATRAYRHNNFFPKPNDPVPVPVFRTPSPTVEDLAAAIARAGVRRVDGDLMVDDTLFDARRTQPGWIPDYTRNDPDIGYISALTVNEGFSDVKGKNLYADPAAGAGNALKAALAGAGVVVTGSVRRGTAPSNAGEIARVLSPPLDQIISYTNRFSINYCAELMLKALGARFGSGGTSAAGAAVVRSTLAAQGIPVEGLTQIDGSGLSTLNRSTPRTIAAIVQWILTSNREEATALRDSFPVAGGPGTLFRRMTKPPTGGNLRGKTAFIRHVRGMAGWVTPSDGVPLVYVALFNQVPKPLELTSPLDLIGLALALFGAP